MAVLSKWMSNDADGAAVEQCVAELMADERRGSRQLTNGAKKQYQTRPVCAHMNTSCGAEGRDGWSTCAISPPAPVCCRASPAAFYN